jgi:hypothetical protein
VALSSLQDLLDELLESVIDLFAAQGVTLPARRFVSWTLPNEEVTESGCDEHLAVYLVRLMNSSTPPYPSDPLGPCGVGQTGLQIGVEVTRCAPDTIVGDDRIVPSVDDLEIAAAAAAQDAWILHCGLRKTSTNLFGALGQQCGMAHVLVEVAPFAQGGIYGSTAVLQAVTEASLLNPPN